MNEQKRKIVRRVRRSRRVRRHVFGTADRPRLNVSRSHRNISVQLIDDITGRTLCSAGTNTKALGDEIKYGGNCEAAAKIGQILAERARMQGIRKVAFDRNGLRYHGRVKALAEAARKSGLEF
ncbi:MAG: 50S ribosomal protein L18 [Phycisphaerales bacterium]|nr:50S ribosomal protein L18 [Phycisphaerales bacterium]